MVVRIGGGMRYGTRSNLFFLGLALPSLVGLLVFFVIPFGYSLFLSMIDNPVGRNFVGFQNFRITLNNTAFRLAAQNTLLFIAICVPVNMVFPLVVSMALNKVPRKELFGLFFLLPLVVPSGSIVHFWRSMFGINGFVNGLFFQEYPVNWLSTDWAFYIILVIFMWKNAGFNIVLYQAGLSQIPRDYYEVAALEGAGRFRQFRSVTLVYLLPTIFLVFLMSLLATFRSFREIYLLAGAHPHRSIYMLQHFMNNQFAALDYQRMSTAAFVIAACIAAMAVTLLYMQRRVTSHD